MVSLKGLKALEKIKNHLRKLNEQICNDDFIHLFEMLPFITVEKELKVLEIILNSPFIIDNLAELGKLPPEAKKRYLFGTITNSEVEKVEEFFKDGEK